MKYVLALAAGLAAVILIIEPKTVSDAVGAAAVSCLEVVVPSLFAFTVLAIYLQKSGLYRTVLKPLTFPLSKLLRMDEELCAVFLLGNIGGYPVGARLLSELVREGRLKQKNAARALCFCFGSGPGFMLGIVGARIFGSAAAGLALFGICFGVSLLIAGFVRMRGEIPLERAAGGDMNVVNPATKSQTGCLRPKAGGDTDVAKPATKSQTGCLRPKAGGFKLDAETFITSVTDGARTMFTVCAMIVGFSVISAILKVIGVYALFAEIFGSSEILPALLEITRLGDMTATEYALPTCAALLAFGGACVIMQVAALSRGIPLKNFLISRGAAAVLSALLAMPFAGIFPPADVETIAAETAVSAFSKNAALSVCVLIMCVLLLVARGSESRGKKPR
ncbi:MAG: hypothetical protein K2J77_10265 [Oscillospiraceae bacterium]|nr:hypothetical protein [Oscillospiraceae bacterium]